jgi:hypothetical protein
LLLDGSVSEVLTNVGASARASLGTVKAAIGAGMRASQKAPPSFRVIIAQPELDLGVLDGMPVFEPAPEPPPLPAPPPPAIEERPKPAATAGASSWGSRLRSLAAKVRARRLPSVATNRARAHRRPRR